MRELMFFISYKREDIFGDDTVRLIEKLVHQFERFKSVDQLYLFEAGELLASLLPYLSGDTWFATTVSKHVACERLQFIASHNIRSRLRQPDNNSKTLADVAREQRSVILESPLQERAKLDCSFAQTGSDLRIFKEAISRISKSGRVLKNSSAVRDTRFFLAKWNELNGNALIRIDFCNSQIMHENNARAELARLCDSHRLCPIDATADFVASVGMYFLNDRSIDSPCETLDGSYSLVAARDLYLGAIVENRQTMGLLDSLCDAASDGSESDFVRQQHRRAPINKYGFSYRKSRNVFFGDGVLPN